MVVETQAWHFLSLHISHGSLSLSLRELSSKLVVEDTVSLPSQASLPLLTRLIAEVDAFFTRHQRQLERLTAIAVTVPGIIDAQAGIIHRMPWYDVCDIPLGEVLSSHIGMPVYLQHDICAWTMAEVLYGAARGCNDVVQIVIDHNVDSVLNDVPLSVERLCSAALAGDRVAQEIITGVGLNVGRILAMMVNLFNPEKILVGSPLNGAASILYPVMQRCIQQQSLPDYSRRIQIQATRFSHHGTMPGAALVKDALYDGLLLLKLMQG